MAEHQKSDEECSKLIENLLAGDVRSGNYQMKKGLLCYVNARNKSSKIFVPRDLRPMMLNYFHDSPLGAHLGQFKTMNKINRDFYWPNMKGDIFKYVRSCEICQQCKPALNSQIGFHSADVANCPGEKFFIDYFGPLVRSQSGHIAVLSVIDAFSKFIWLFPVRQINSNVTCDILSKHIFGTFGPPKMLVSDNASSFTCRRFRNMCFAWGIKHVLLSPHNPGPNQVERVHRNLKSCLSAFHAADQSKWNTNLPLFCLAFNSAIHESSQYTPAELFLGRKLNDPLQLQWNIDYLSRPSRQMNVQQKWEIALAHLKKARDRVAKRFNKGRKAVPFKVGDTVLVKSFPVSSAANQISAKLCPRWSTPKRIVEFLGPVSVRLEDLGNGRFSKAHVASLKPFHRRDT